MLTRLRNAQARGLASTRIPASKLKLAILNLLAQEGFVESVSVEEDGVKKNLLVTLKYEQVNLTKKRPAIQDIVRVSKEGRRSYVKRNEVAKVKNGYGIAIVSTSQGVMTGGEAYAKGLGGEYICQVW
jgi:small subunit ribosomal protein S8